MSVKQETILSSDIREEFKLSLKSTQRTTPGTLIRGEVPPDISSGVEYEVEDGVYVGVVREDEAVLPEDSNVELRDNCLFVYVYVADMGEYKRRGGVTDESACACLSHESELFRALSRELALVITEVFDCSPEGITFGRQTSDDSAHGVYYAMELLVQP